MESKGVNQANLSCNLKELNRDHAAGCRYKHTLTLCSFERDGASQIKAASLFMSVVYFVSTPHTNETSFYISYFEEEINLLQFPTK